MIELKCNPCDNMRLTATFGKDILNGKERWHNGVDYAMQIGTPIYAVANGIVQVAKDNPGGYGLYIAVDHGHFGSLSAHLSKFNCKIGQIVKAGQTIGYSGNTGMSMGPHLHFEIRNCVYSKFWEREANSKYTHAVDPQPLLNMIKIKTDREKVQEHFGFDNSTMIYLDKHPYFRELYKKLSKDYK